MGSGHGKCWLVVNGGDGNKYYTFCRKYSDEYETTLKAKVKERTGQECRNVRRENSKPTTGIEIVL